MQLGVDQEELAQVLDKVANTLVYAVNSIVEAMQEVARCINSWDWTSLSKALQSLEMGEELFFMVPQYIKHLAYNHPKSRVRNKNWNRMWKMRERYFKCHR